MSDASGGKQSFEQLKSRYDKLHRRKIQAEANLENAKKQLDELKAQARKEYGTDDVEALKSKLEQMRTENEKKRTAYQEALNKIESDLAIVEEKYHYIDNGDAGA